MFTTRKNNTFAVTYRTTNVASLRGVSRIDKFNIDSFPVSFVKSVFSNSAVNPVCKSSIHVFSSPTPLWSAPPQIFQSNHSIILFSNFNNSLGNIMSNPVVYSSDFSPEPSNLLTASLPFWKERFEVVYPSPKIPNFIKEFSILQKFNIGDFAISMENGNYGEVPQSNINTNNRISLLNGNSLPCSKIDTTRG